MIAALIIMAATAWQEPASCSRWLSDNAAAVSACQYARRKHQEDVERRLQRLEEEGEQ